MMIPVGAKTDLPFSPGAGAPGACLEDESVQRSTAQGEGPAEASESGRPTVEVQIRLLPQKANDNLGNFFSTSETHLRLYAFLVALIRHHALRTASAMAFDLFLALIPMLALAAWLVSHLLDDSPDTLLQGGLIMDLTPNELRAFVSEQLRAYTGQHFAPAALLVCWWLASSAFSTMIALFEENFSCTPRSWFEGRVLALGFALVGLTLFVLATAAGFWITLAPLTPVRSLLHALSEQGLLPPTLLLAGVFVITAYLALIYRWSIRRPGIRRRIWPGALVAALLGVGASIALGYYAANIARYSLFYGSLAAIVVVMLWLWLWCSAILLGAELNVALEDVGVLRTDGNGATSNEQMTPG